MPSEPSGPRFWSMIGQSLWPWRAIHMANQNRTMSVSYRWTEDAKELRQVTHKWKFSHPFPLPNFGRSFIVANNQPDTPAIH